MKKVKKKSRGFLRRQPPGLLHRRLLQKIKGVVKKQIRPYIQMHGGDIEVLGLTSGKVLKVRFRGACAGCPYAANTLEFGVKDILLDAFPNENLKIILIK